MDIGFQTAIEYVGCAVVLASVIGFVLMAMALSNEALMSLNDDERDGVAIG